MKIVTQPELMTRIDGKGREVLTAEAAQYLTQLYQSDNPDDVELADTLLDGIGPWRLDGPATQRVITGVRDRALERTSTRDPQLGTVNRFLRNLMTLPHLLAERGMAV